MPAVMHCTWQPMPLSPAPLSRSWSDPLSANLERVQKMQPHLSGGLYVKVSSRYTFLAAAGA